MHRRALGQRQLGGQVGGGPEAVDAETPTGRQLGAAEGTKADDAGAQQRCRLFVAEAVGKGQGVGLVDHRELGVAAVVVPAGEPRGGAEVLVTADAPAAAPARVAQPGDPGALARLEAGGTRPDRIDDADDLVTGNDAPTPRLDVALGEVEVGAAHAARRDADADLARSGHRTRSADGNQRAAGDRSRAIDHPGEHLVVVARHRGQRSAGWAIAPPAGRR